MKTEQIQQAINTILARNEGNRLTTEVSAGIGMAILQVINAVRVEDYKAHQEELKSIAEAQDPTPVSAPQDITS